MTTKTTLSSQSNIAKLEKSEPFTPTELHRYDRQTRFFIRGIQITEGCDKKEAFIFYKKYKNTMPKHTRQIYSKKVHKAIADDSAGKRTKKGLHGKYEMMNKPLTVHDILEHSESDEDDDEDFEEEEF